MYADDMIYDIPRREIIKKMMIMMRWQRGFQENISDKYV